MCGIAGWMGLADEAGRHEKVSRMIALQSHRGPDATGIFHESSVTLGHARLSIIDPHEHSNQPFFSTDGRYVVTFNGEIYNHAEIRATLSQNGLIFRTTSDTEVLVEAYRVFGAQCLDQFEGMFAFAIFDRHTKELFCARDRLGEKPFYYSWSKVDGFAFASEMSALIPVCLNTNNIDPVALKYFLSASYSKSPATLLSHIRQLPAGHYLSLVLGMPPEVKCYWSPVAVAENARLSSPCNTEEFLFEFDRAVRQCTTSDVPFGAFLSGGLDSSAVVDSLTRQKLGGAKLSTYTLDYSDRSFSELTTAKQTAALLDVNFESVSYEDYESDLPDIIRLAAEVPIADPSFLPLFIVARAAGSRFKVMLGGDGGDELLFGYDTYRATMLSDVLSRIDLKPLQSILRLLVNPATLFSKNVSFTEKLWRLTSFHVPHSPLRSHMAWRTIFADSEIAELCAEETITDLGGWLLEQIPGHLDWSSDDSLPILTRAALIDYCSWLSDGVLRKLDSALMYNSVEGRTPFVNSRLINAGFRLRMSDKMSLTKGKIPLRFQLGRSGLSHVCQQKKSGFGFPLDRLFRGSLRDMLFDELSSNATSSIFRREVVLKYLTEHDRGLANHGRKLYCLLVLAIWYSRVLGA